MKPLLHLHYGVRGDPIRCKLRREGATLEDHHKICNVQISYGTQIFNKCP